MIVERHNPAYLFALLAELRLEMGPELAALDGLLEDETLFSRATTYLSPSCLDFLRVARYVYSHPFPCVGQRLCGTDRIINSNTLAH